MFHSAQRTEIKGGYFTVLFITYYHTSPGVIYQLHSYVIDFWTVLKDCQQYAAAKKNVFVFFCSMQNVSLIDRFNMEMLTSCMLKSGH